MPTLRTFTCAADVARRARCRDRIRSRHLPPELKARHPNIPWVAGIGNVLRHNYENVASAVMWKLAHFDLLRSTPSGDYWAFVQRTRLFSILSQDVRVLEHLQEDLRRKIVKAGFDPDSGSIAEELARKDGKRRFQKLVEDHPSIINVLAPHFHAAAGAPSRPLPRRH